MAKMAASSRFSNVSDEEIAVLNISAVPKSTQYATKYGVKIFKGKTASLNLLLYFETVQKPSVSTAGAEKVNRKLKIVTPNYKLNVTITEFLCCSALKLY